MAANLWTQFAGDDVWRPTASELGLGGGFGTLVAREPCLQEEVYTYNYINFCLHDCVDNFDPALLMLSQCA